MEHQHYHNQQHEDNNGNGSGGSGRSSMLCRQSSTRWIPTTDQIRILKDLYYNSGLRSPNGDQIQRISARLRQYGKIEGKNVFYWFQNHKARERQKKRLTVDINANNNKLNNMSPAGASPPSSAVYDMGSSAAGSLLMERAYRECALPGGVTVEGNMGWVGVETATMPPQFYYHQQRTAAATYYQEAGYYHNHLHQTQQQQGEEEAGMETLPLFPTHSEAGEQDQEGHVNSCMQPYSFGTINGFHHHLLPNNGNCSDMDASLELSLNSYCTPHGSM